MGFFKETCNSLSRQFIYQNHVKANMNENHFTRKEEREDVLNVSGGDCCTSLQFTFHLNQVPP